MIQNYFPKEKLRRACDQLLHVVKIKVRQLQSCITWCSLSLARARTAVPDERVACLFPGTSSFFQVFF